MKFSRANPLDHSASHHVRFALATLAGLLRTEHAGLWDRLIDTHSAVSRHPRPYDSVSVVAAETDNCEACQLWEKWATSAGADGAGAVADLKRSESRWNNLRLTAAIIGRLRLDHSASPADAAGAIGAVVRGVREQSERESSEKSEPERRKIGTPDTGPQPVGTTTATKHLSLERVGTTVHDDDHSRAELISWACAHNGITDAN